MYRESIVLKDGCRTAIIYPRTFGGFRITMNDWYFEIVAEEYADTYEEAKAIGTSWIQNEKQ